MQDWYHLMLSCKDNSILHSPELTCSCLGKWDTGVPVWRKRAPLRTWGYWGFTDCHTMDSTGCRGQFHIPGGEEIILWERYLNSCYPTVVVCIDFLAVRAHVCFYDIFHHKGLLQNGSIQYFGLDCDLDLEPSRMGFCPNEAGIYQLDLHPKNIVNACGHLVCGKVSSPTEIWMCASQNRAVAIAGSSDYSLQQNCLYIISWDSTCP